MTKSRNQVYTIGHSNHEPKEFLTLLRMHGVDAVVDVRSAPYSRYLPHFNRERLAATLKDTDIRYAFKGKELGGQPADRTFYDAEGHVLYGELAQTPAYGEGIEFITDNAVDRGVALMCSEKEPLDCHRSLMIGQTLAARGIAVAHIHADGSLESQEDAIDRLLEQLKLPPNGDLFRSRDEVIDDAVDRQAQKVGARWHEASASGPRSERAL